MPLPTRRQFLVLLALVVTYGLVQPWFATTSERVKIETDAMRLPKASALQTSSLNYRTLAADLAWVMSLIGRGEDVRKKRESGYYLDNGMSLTRTDPFFRRAYDLFPALYLQSKKNITHDDLMRIADFLDLGIERFPNDVDLVYAAGIVFIGYSADHADEDRIKQVERAIGYLTKASRMPGAHQTTPGLLAYFTNRLAQLTDRGESQVWSSKDKDLLLEIFLQNQNPKFGDYLLRQLTLLGVDGETLKLQKQARAQKILDAKSRDGKSYLPTGLYWTVIHD